MDGEANAAAASQDPTLVGQDGQSPDGIDDMGLRQPPEEEKLDEVIPEEILEDMKNLWSVFDMD